MTTRQNPWPYSTLPFAALKVLLVLGLLAAVTRGQTSQATGNAALRQELSDLLRAGKTEDAVRRAQDALHASPRDAGVRAEYVQLHLALAESWLAQRRYEACTAALDAVVAVEPEQPRAAALLREIRAARARAGQQTGEIDRLLSLELFESALDQIHAAQALRPELADGLRDRARAAWLGAADDHYLARNFSEAFALYENLLAIDADASPRVHSRWAASLALALAEGDFGVAADPNVPGRLLARAIDVLRKTGEPILGEIIGGMLAEQAGQFAEAGRTYAEALGVRWELPPADQRREAVRRLREQAIVRARAIYADLPTQRRDGFWAVALPDVWKHRQTAHFDVYAPNDLIAERLADAAEYHFAGVSRWLGIKTADTWDPRCEIRVHATRDALQRATATSGITSAVSATRLQGERVLARKLEVFQADPWLLSSTLPHELTHLLIADALRQSGLPLAIDEGLALQAEPPARRLMYRRLLAAQPPAPDALLAVTQVPADAESFYAEAGALTNWLLDRVGAARPAKAESGPAAELLSAFRGGVQPEWWRAFALDSTDTLRSAWAEWYAVRRTPARMPLMILVEPAAEHRKQPASRATGNKD